MLEEIAIQCLYCFETFTITATAEDGNEQNFIYDCEICCHPIQITLVRNENTSVFEVNTHKGNE